MPGKQTPFKPQAARSTLKSSTIDYTVAWSLEKEDRSAIDEEAYRSVSNREHSALGWVRHRGGASRSQMHRKPKRLPRPRTTVAKRKQTRAQHHVQGQGTVSAKPDLVTLSLGRSDHRRNRAWKRLALNSEQMTAASSTQFRQPASRMKDIQTSGINLYPVYEQSAAHGEPGEHAPKSLATGRQTM